ncbi:cyclic nucleotide-binding domain-containing protein [Paenibacillus cymbidii]|uniref:cyclic nucleotide-binding domain-containing protein n=1 Tax=Paenibacillus cymbidii TaxID=1639034 RepID=UPI00108035E6|nr:cyclic nucleotide-binding domain-containing protein [Paenibacillus cymbidii]
MTKALRLLGLRAEDTRKLWIMAPVFLCGGIAELLNYSGFMALFNQRFGVQHLPLMYIVEAMLLPLEGWLLAKMASLLPKPKLMRTLYLLMALALLANGLVLLGFKLGGIDFIYYYPILFLSSNFVVRQMTLLLWATAFDLCPTQQAKRLMPIFVASATIGGIVAGFVAQVFVKWFGTEVVYALAPVVLLIGYRYFRLAIAKYLVPLTLKAERKSEAAAAPQEEALTTGQYARLIVGSPFLLCAMALMTLMPALYFLIEYQYFNAAQTTYPNESDLTAFYGIVITLQFTFSLVLQTVSTRLMNWLGASNMLLAITVVFLGGFAVTTMFVGAPHSLAAVSCAYAVIYILYYYFAEPCYQLFFKMQPLGRRDGIRYVVQAIAASAGILFGALLSLLHSSGWIELTPQAAIGLVLAVALVATAWYSRNLYMKELVRSVQTLHDQLSDIAESFFGGIRQTKAMQAILGYLQHPNDYVRELALEIAGKAKDPAHLPQLIGLIHEDSPRIKLAALRAMTLHGADLQQLVQVASFLEDEDVEVRSECVRLLGRAKHLKSQAHFFIRMKLLDAHPHVASEAILALYTLGSDESYAACGETIVKLLDTGGESAVYGCRTIAALGLDSYAEWVESLLGDDKPAVKVAAAACLGKLRRRETVPRLLAMYPLADKELRKAIVQAFADMGEPALSDLFDGMKQPDPLSWKAAVVALAGILPERRVRELLVDACLARIADIGRNRALPEALRALGLSEAAALCERRYGEIRDALSDAAWAVLAALADEQVVATIRQAVTDADDDVRENGLEALAEGPGDRRLAAALFALLQQDAAAAARPAVLEAAATRADAGEGKAPVQAALEVVRHEAEAAGADGWLRQIAGYALDMERRKEAGDMQEERKFLSLLDKVVFLKQVELFAHLSVDELGLIAGIASEEVHPDGAFLIQAGETFSRMYIIVDGNIELSGTMADGSIGTIGVLGPKMAFGETAILDQSASAVSAQAFFDEVRVLALRGEDLARLVRLYPEIGIGLLQASGARVRLLESMLMKMG